MTCEKKTESVKVWMDEKLFSDLARLADRDDRKLSEFIERVLRLHLYGHVARPDETKEGAKRD